LLNEIDFFKNTHTIVGNNKKTKDTKKSKAKKNKTSEAEVDDQQDEEDEEGDEEELFTSQEEVIMWFLY
jgi:hypothetical protein